MKLPVTLRALQYRNFQLFFGGQLISLVGTWMQYVAESWLVYRLTHSSVLLGVIGFAGQIPVFLLSPAAGIVADRFRRQWVVICTQTSAMLLAFTLAALTLTGAVRIWHIFALAATLGVVNAFDIPARQSFIVEMVGKQDLMNAIALNSSMFNASRVVGPAIAGLLVAGVGEGWCFFLNGASYIAVIAGLLLMNVPRRAAEQRVGSPMAHIVEGFRFVAHNLPMYALLMQLAVVSLSGMSYTVLMPIFADRILHGGAEALGVLMGALGVGALSAALVLASRQTLKGLNRWAAIATFTFGVGMIAFSFSHNLLLSEALLIPVGFSMMIEMGSSNTLIQSMVPDRLRGRIMAVYSMTLVGMAPLGALIAGAAADRFGAPRTVAAAGVVCMAAAAVFWTQLPKIREHARRLIAAQEQEIEGVSHIAAPAPGRHA
jgi:MFS family permease